MGADYLSARIPLDAEGDTISRVLVEIDNLDRDALDEANESMTGGDDLTDDEIRQALRLAATRSLDGSNREVDFDEIDGTSWLTTGGMSYGDSPTQAFDDFNALWAAGLVKVPSPWDDDPTFPSEDWKLEVANDDTRLGYRAWVQHKKDNQ